jgi:hypothetical protein
VNTIYKVVWNAASGKYVVASELAKGRKKTSRNMLAGALAIALAASAPFGAAFAANTGTTCTTAEGQLGELDTEGVCTADTVGTSLASNSSMSSLGMGIMAAGDYAASSDGTATATGGAGVAIGHVANSSAQASTAIGANTWAGGNASIAIGGSTQTGLGAQAFNHESIAIGEASSSRGDSSIVIGVNSNDGSASNYGNNAVAIGAGASASNGGQGTADAGVAVGSSASAFGTNALALGNSAVAGHSGTMALGATANALGSGSVAIGVGANVGASTSGAMAIGNGASVGGTVQNSVALGQSASTGRNNVVSVGIDSGAGATSTRQVVNVANGTLSNDAVNVSQLQGALTALGTTFNADGSVTQPTYALTNGGTTHTVGDALSGLDTALSTANTNISNNTTEITTLKNELSNGTVGLVQQAASGATLTVGANTDGVAVDFTGTAGNRKLIGVADGTVATNSHEAVNGGQLLGTAQSVADAIGGGAIVNSGGSISQPTYTIGDGNGGSITVHSIGGAITNIDGRVTNNETSITNIQGQLESGSIGLVQQDAAGTISVAGATGGRLVDFTGSDGMRRLTGVANGVNDSDAVTIAQLKATGLIDYTGKELGALVYDDLTLGTATLGGVGGTIIDNLKNGLIAAGSMQAVNGGQLFDMQQSFQSKFDLLNGKYDSLDGRIGTIEQGIADGTIGGGGGGVDPSLPGSGEGSTQIGNGAVASGESSTAVGKDAIASGSNSTATGAGSQATGNNSTANGAGAIASGNGSTAVGAGAVASGTDSTALGSNSSATGNNSVALGAGSVADRDNTVSVGSEGNERQITNVAAGTQRTDAANWGQVQDAVNGVRDWADQKFHQMDKRINRMGAMGAAYGQMAFSANGLDTKNRLGVGVGTQGGQSALAVGYSRQIKPNLNLSFGGSASAGDVSVGAGMAYGW